MAFSLSFDPEPRSGFAPMVVTLHGTITEAPGDPHGNYSVVIDWGDGSSPDPFSLINSAGGAVVDLYAEEPTHCKHTYIVGGTHHFIIVVDRSGGTQQSQTIPITVALRSTDSPPFWPTLDPLGSAKTAGNVAFEPAPVH